MVFLIHLRLNKKLYKNYRIIEVTETLHSLQLHNLSHITSRWLNLISFISSKKLFLFSN